MNRRLDETVAALTAAAETSCKFALNSLRSFVFGPATAYQPEKYYMRGPGPKWRAKHGIGHILGDDDRAQ
jgi:hypothetical protein